MADNLSPLEWLLLQVNKPVSSVAGGVLAARQNRNPLDAILENLQGTRQDSFGDVLTNEGVSPGMARAGGLALDVVADPLNLLPIGKMAKLAGVGKLAKIAGDTTPVKWAGKALGQVFDPFHGLPEDYIKSRRLFNSGRTYDKSKAVEDTLEMFKGISPEERELLASAVETPDVLKAAAPERLPALQTTLDTYNKSVGGMAEQEIAAGVLKPGQVERILTDYKGYVPYRFKDTKKLQEVLKKPVRELSGVGKFAKPRSLESFEEAKNAGAITDLAQLHAQRGYEGAQSMRVNKFVDEVLSNPEWAVAIPEGGLPAEYSSAGWRTIATNTANPVAEKVKTFAVHPDIAPDLEKVFSPRKITEFGKAFDKLTNMWKNVATTMKPGFTPRNLVSNAFNSWLGGMSPAAMPLRYAEATAIMAGKLPAKVGAYNGPELLTKMKEYGVMGSEFGFTADIGDTIDNQFREALKSSTRKVAEGVATLGLKPWAKAGRKVSSTVEDTSKVALFLDQVRKGVSAEDAALHVKKYLFDYQELTDTERNVLRRAVPFYTWLRKNVPLQLEHLVSDTGKYSNVASAYKETEGLAEDRGIAVPHADRPNFLSKLSAVQMPFLSKSGEKEFFNPNLPFQDLGKIPWNGENIGEISQDQIASLHPVAKAIIERTLNQSIFKDRPLYRKDMWELVDAPMSAQLFAQAFPDLAKQVNITRRRVNGEVKWQMPEVSSYILEQIPVFSTLGKAAVNTGDPSSAAPLPLPNETVDGAVPEKLMRPPALDFFLGTKFLPQSDKQIRKDKKYRRQEKQNALKAKRKEQRSLLSEEDIQALLAGK